MKKALAPFIAILIVFFAGCERRPKIEKNSENRIPVKIVSLSPAATEILFAIGASNQIAAVSEFSNYPEQAKELPCVGGFDGKTLSMERILSFEPDFVYLTKGMHDFLIPQLKQFNIPYYVSKGDSIQSLETEILDIARITGHPESGEPLVQIIEEKIALAKAAVQNHDNDICHNLIYWEIWHEPFTSIGKKSFLADLLRKCGLTNIFDDVEQPYPQVSTETIICKNPDFIIIPSQNSISATDILKRPGWKNITAVQNNNILIVDSDLFSQPGPRIGECAENLCKYIVERREK